MNNSTSSSSSSQSNALGSKPGRYQLRRSKTQGLVSGGPALIDAVNSSKVHLAKFILDALDKSSNIVEYRDFKGKTPLIRTCFVQDSAARMSILSLLLEYGADVNATCEKGRTLLSYSCERNCNDIVRKLLQCANVNPNIVDEEGNTPLMYCVISGNHVGLNLILRSFRRLGLNIDAMNNQRQTASILAIKNGNLCCLRSLIVDGHAYAGIIDAESGRNILFLAADAMKMPVGDFDIGMLPKHDALCQSKTADDNDLNDAESCGATEADLTSDLSKVHLHGDDAVTNGKTSAQEVIERRYSETALIGDARNSGDNNVRQSVNQNGTSHSLAVRIRHKHKISDSLLLGMQINEADEVADD